MVFITTTPDLMSHGIQQRHLAGGAATRRGETLRQLEKLKGKLIKPGAKLKNQLVMPSQEKKSRKGSKTGWSHYP